MAGERSWKKKQLLETRNGRERGREGEGVGDVGWMTLGAKRGRLARFCVEEGCY